MCIIRPLASHVTFSAPKDLCQTKALHQALVFLLLRPKIENGQRNLLKNLWQTQPTFIAQCQWALLSLLLDVFFPSHRDTLQQLNLDTLTLCGNNDLVREKALLFNHCFNNIVTSLMLCHYVF